MAARFFQAQIDASKMIQSERVAAWKAEGHEHFTDVPDLHTVIRPKLDALTPALLVALKDVFVGTEASRELERALKPMRLAGVAKMRLASGAR